MSRSSVPLEGPRRGAGTFEGMCSTFGPALTSIGSGSSPSQNRRDALEDVGELLVVMRVRGHDAGPCSMYNVGEHQPLTGDQGFGRGSGVEPPRAAGRSSGSAFPGGQGPPIEAGAATGLRRPATRPSSCIPASVKAPAANHLGPPRRRRVVGSSRRCSRRPIRLGMRAATTVPGGGAGGRGGRSRFHRSRTASRVGRPVAGGRATAAGSSP